MQSRDSSNHKQNKKLGLEAEQIAAAYYRERGYSVLARNFRLPYGELDLVVGNEEEVVVVEVKGRSRFRDWEAEHPRWRQKKRRMRRVVQVFLGRFEHLLPDFYGIRLDIVYVTQGRVSEVYEGEPFV